MPTTAVDFGYEYTGGITYTVMTVTLRGILLRHQEKFQDLIGASTCSYSIPAPLAALYSCSGCRQDG